MSLTRSGLKRRLTHLAGREWRRTQTTSSSRNAQPAREETSSEPATRRRSGVENFAFARHGSFVQAEPQHQNSWTSDKFLTSYFKLNLPEEVFREIEPDLHRFGERTAGEIWQLGRECEENPPYLKQTDAWGRRIDQIVTSPAWKRQKSIAAEEGLIAIPYERKLGEYSRLYQVAKLFMYGPASGLYSCPLAMTDGAAKTVESLALDLPEAWHHLTSRDPRLFWTAGQWMTEKRGGSDVGDATETYAVHHQGKSFKLHGYKWFSSATDSDMALTLARIVDDQGVAVSGSKGISMFYLKTRKEPNGALNNIQVVKLKNKLGTRQLPTAELLLDGTEAELVSSEGRGIASISSMLTVTRLHNVIMSVGYMRKITSLARDYAMRRNAFKSSIDAHPLHLQTLGRMEVETRGCCALMLDLARQMGMHDAKTIPDQDLLLLRLMTPVAKLYTGKQAVAVVSEGLECFGGQGYIEDTGLPGMLRDAQVLPIWEGTSNVMSLDVVRAIAKTKGEVLKAFNTRIRDIAQQVQENPQLAGLGERVGTASSKLCQLLQAEPQLLQSCGRDLAVSLANVYIAALLIQHAARSKEAADLEVARAWIQRDLAPVLAHPQIYAPEYVLSQKNLVYQNYHLD